LCKRMLRAEGITCPVVQTDVWDEALDGADFVLAQIRVGKLPARILDEKIPLKHRMIGQETCGIGGMFKGLRTIPVLMALCERMQALCPNAWLINFSNPAGIAAQAILNHTPVKMLGLCNAPFGMFKSVREQIKLEPDAFIEYLGLNHLSWITAIRQGDRDHLKEAITQGPDSEAMKSIPNLGFSPEVIRQAGGLPSYYLEYYYFREKKLKDMLDAKESRGEACVRIEEELLAMYSDLNLTVKPEQLSQRGGAHYSESAVSLVDAIHNDRNELHVVNILNGGALPFMADDDAIEITARVGAQGAKPVPAPGFANSHIIGYMRTVKAYEREVVQAALHGDIDAAMRALLINPLAGDYHNARACFYEMLEAHRAYLPQFPAADKE
ncbi:MAG: 6-phospho-beta-glucosidase, partial [Clostridia bacterium]|nr:6-phospho-beta-glucosidase [Clostridia bacterium]